MSRLTEAEDTPLKGHFMQVELLVEAQNAAAFEQQLAAFLGGSARPFARLDPSSGHELVLALKGLEAFVFAGEPPLGGALGASGAAEPLDAGGSAAHLARAVQCVDPRVGRRMVRYVHLWRLASRRDLELANIMMRSADDTPYMRVNALVGSERQDFVRIVQRQGWPGVDTSLGQCLRIVRRFASEKLGTYIFRSGVLVPILQERGWRLLGQFQNVTGPLNTVTELWQMRSGLDPQRMYDGALLGDLHQKLVDDVCSKLPFHEQRELCELPRYFGALIPAHA